MLPLQFPEALVISTRRPSDVARLRDRLVEFFARDLVEGELRVSYDRQRFRGDIFGKLPGARGAPRRERRGFRVRVHPRTLERLRGLLET